jgi:hypothetical protein
MAKTYKKGGITYRKDDSGKVSRVYSTTSTDSQGRKIKTYHGGEGGDRTVQVMDSQKYIKQQKQIKQKELDQEIINIEKAKILYPNKSYEQLNEAQKEQVTSSNLQTMQRQQKELAVLKQKQTEEKAKRIAVVGYVEGQKGTSIIKDMPEELTAQEKVYMSEATSKYGRTSFQGVKKTETPEGTQRELSITYQEEVPKDSVLLKPTETKPVEEGMLLSEQGGAVASNTANKLNSGYADEFVRKWNEEKEKRESKEYKERIKKIEDSFKGGTLVTAEAKKSIIEEASKVSFAIGSTTEKNIIDVKNNINTKNLIPTKIDENFKSNTSLIIPKLLTSSEKKEIKERELIVVGETKTSFKEQLLFDVKKEAGKPILYGKKGEVPLSIKYIVLGGIGAGESVVDTFKFVGKSVDNPVGKYKEIREMGLQLI